jgi:hypothetical protein
MSGLIRKIIGAPKKAVDPGPTSAQLAQKEQAKADATRAQAETKRKKEEAATALEKSKKKRRTIGRRSSILTSPLGVVDTTSTQTLG